MDNISILVFTALLSELSGNNKKYIKSKKIKPKKEIDDRLKAIGYWEALCFNVPQAENLDFIKIVSHKEEKTHNSLHAEIVQFSMQKVDIQEWHKDVLCDAVFEAMANAKEHAYNEQEKKIWLMGDYDKEKNEIELIFYDIGMGIFASLENNMTKVAKLLTRFSKIYGMNKTLEKLCSTNLSKYKNDKSRGLGMVVFKTLIDELLKERKAILEVYTGDSYYSTSKDNTNKFGQQIRGTLIRWIIGGKK